MRPQPSTTVHAVIAADPLVVWRILADVPRTSTWSEGIHRCSWDTPVDPDIGPKEGDSWTADFQRGRMQWSSRCSVLCAQPGTLFAFAVSGIDHPTAVWTYQLKPDSTGCLLNYTVTLGDGPSMFDGLSAADSPDRPALEQRRLDELARAMQRTVDRDLRARVSVGTMLARQLGEHGD